MDGSRFDAISKTLGTAGTRRVALRTGIGISIAAGLARLGLSSTTAKKKQRKRRKKWKKLQKNAFGCVNVGGACRGKDANCCSGICQGLPKYGSKKDTSRCVAHDVLDCVAGANTCLQGAVACGPNADGECYQTTGQAGFCAGSGTCLACAKDADCAALGYGPGAACVVCPKSCAQTGNTACMAAA
jgi:hypothetical protein